MKTKTAPSASSMRRAGVIACVAFACSISAHAAPPEASQPTAPAREALQPTRDAPLAAAASTREAVSAAWDKCKDATFKQREKVRESMKAAEASLDAKIVEWTARKDAVKDESKPAVAAAQKELREAREVLGQKIDALDNATVETWASVKAELNTAWQRMTTAASDLAAKLKS